MKWLPEAIDLLEKEPRTACVGASESPQFLSPMFGNGLVEAPLGLETLKYAEASVLLFNSDIFRRIGMFDELLQWAMCEDADLSLRESAVAGCSCAGSAYHTSIGEAQLSMSCRL